MGRDSKARRGRPRQYDPDTALARLTESFWKSGYAAVSLDELASAAGMNRPSLHAAFGNKHDLYLKTLQRYRDQARATAKAILEDDPPLRVYLRRFYGAALDVYFSGSDTARGCYSISTAATQCANDSAVRSFLVESIEGTDAFLAELFRKAQDLNEIEADADPLALARIGTATLHTLAVRARAGFARKDLDAIAETAVNLLVPARTLGAAKWPPR